MFLTTSLLSLASLAILGVQGAPLDAARRASGSISADCTDITLKGDWLVANCLTGVGETRIQSTVYLSSKITNSEGTLGWKMNGAYANSCSSCTVADGAKLKCLCNHSWNAKENTTLDLEDHIANYKGLLKSDLAGTPSMPDSVSDVPMPSDLSWSLSYGNVSCYSPDSDYCAKYPFTSEPACQSSPSVTSKSTPSRCFSFRVPISGEIWEAFGSLSAGSPGKAYEFVIYDNVDCTGTPVSSIKPTELGTCKKFSQPGVGVRVQPLWNADP